MVLYFTATGNSLYVAKHLEENPLSIPQMVKSSRYEFEAESIGIVCPIFSGHPPRMVIDFLKEAQLRTPYLYMLMTYGMDDSDAPEFTANLLQGYQKFDYISTILMVDNYLPAFDMEEQMAGEKEKRIDEQIQKQLRAISERKRGIPDATEEARKLHRDVAEMFRANPALINGEQITVRSGCIGCGTCEKVCPIDNFYVEGNKAKRRQSTCEFCLACVQNCPQKAIGLSIMDKNPNARFRNSAVSLHEIIAANQ